MDLPNLFTVNVSQAGQRVCVLVMTRQSVLAGLLVVHASGSQLLSISEQIPYADNDALLLAADEVLQELGKESEDVNEVVFCLEQNWFDETGELITEKQALLKRIKEELSLQPVGYVLQHETITEHLINQDLQLSCLVLFLSKESVTATLVMQGVISSTVVTGRSGEIQSDVVEALTRVTQVTGTPELPGKILCATIALEVAELFELQQELLTVVWPDSVKFLQSPVVEVIKPQLSAQIVVTGAGKALQQLEGSSAEPVPVGAAVAVAAGEGDGDAGAPPDEEYAIDDSVATASTFGIPVKTVPTVTFAHTDETQAVNDSEISPDHVEQETAHGWLASLLHQRKPTRRHYLLLGGIAIVIGLVIVVLFGYFFLTTTAALEIQVIPKSQQISQEAELILDPSLTEPDIQNRKVQAEKIELELSGTGETAASGIKIVGEKAKGTAVVYNKTTASKAFPAGTVLKSGKLEYVLDEAIEVPSATVSAKPGGTGEEKEYGQRSVNVTATAIGVDNNIDKDVSLNVGDFDTGTYAAKTESALSGGSSREVRVVSQADLDVLLADVKKSLLAQTKSQLESQQAADQKIIPLDQLKIVKQAFSAKEGTEVDTVRLDLDVKATGYAYRPNDLVPIAEALLSGLLPSGYSLEGHTPQILSAGAASGSGQVRVVANLSSKSHALVETEQLRQQLSDQSFEQAAAILTGNPAVEKARFIVKPQLAGLLLKKVPSDSKRFTVVATIPE